MTSTPPPLRLFVLHHAGGSHLLYRHWPAHLPRTWTVQLLDAPGHGLRLDEPSIADARRLADHLLDTIEPELDGPYVLFGHSMGALLAYEIARRALHHGVPTPGWLGLSARPAPRHTQNPTSYHALSDAQLQHHLRQLGGTPHDIFDDPQMWDLYNTVIRSDLRLVENWQQPAADADPLPVPLTAYAGSRDHHAPPPQMAPWKHHTRHFLGLKVFEGGHFYFQDDPRPLLRHVERHATAALTTTTAQ